MNVSKLSLGLDYAIAVLIVLHDCDVEFLIYMWRPFLKTFSIFRKKLEHLYICNWVIYHIFLLSYVKCDN